MLQIHSNIKKIRRIFNKTQQEFSEKMGVSLAMQKSYEGGKANPDLVYIEKLASLTRFPMHDLMSADLSVKEIVEKVEATDFSTVQEPSLSYSDPIQAITDGNKILFEANRTLADANKKLAEAHHILAEGNRELIGIVKGMIEKEMPVNSPALAQDPGFADPGTNTGSEGFRSAVVDKKKKT